MPFLSDDSCQWATTFTYWHLFAWPFSLKEISHMIGKESFYINCKFHSFCCKCWGGKTNFGWMHSLYKCLKTLIWLVVISDTCSHSLQHTIVVSTFMMWVTCDWFNFRNKEMPCEVSSKFFMEGFNCLSELECHKNRPQHVKDTFWSNPI